MGELLAANLRDSHVGQGNSRCPGIAAHRRQRRIVESRDWCIVEPDDADVLWDPPTDLVEGSGCSRRQQI